MTTSAYRLPRNVVPVAYHVDLDASPKRRTFSGRLEATIRVKKSCDHLEMHARDLRISDVVAKADGFRARGQARLRAADEVATLELDRPLPRGSVTVTLSFKGTLNPGMHGLYLAQDGPERAIVSQCEATDARAIFPCFDEPDLKATLQWTVRTDPGLVVITNGALRSQSKSRSTPIRQIHRFLPTRVIPTYLAAITIGRYDGTRPDGVDGTPCRVWSGRGKLDQTDFAREVTAQVVPWFADYFGQPYNYQKLDQVAVPGFDAGAMENVGAIFYRQSLLLMDPQTTSWNGRKRIAEVIAHEIAHQWFGNLVTMRWWDDLWLNEAFATWIAFKACDLWQPAWRMWDDYLEHKQSALEADALVSTHPIYAEVSSPAEATELFDVITYEKGCSVLRMVESYLGEDRFRAGIRRYQKRFKNANAAGADLWNALAEASDQPVGELMRSWIEQPGFPLITVRARTDPNDGNTVLQLGQRRFFARASEMQADHGQTWLVPMVVRYDIGNGPSTHRILLGAEEATVPLPEEGTARWVYPNARGTGFYRMHFGDATLRALLEHGLPHLTPAARMTLVEDQWALVCSGLATVAQFMGVLSALQDDNDHVVVRAMVGRLRFIDQVLVRDDDRELLARLVRQVFARQLERLGYDAEPDEDPSRRVRRACVVRLVGEVGRDAAVLHEARRRVAAEMEDPKVVEANLAGVLTALAALQGDAQLLRRYVDTYTARKSQGSPPELQARYLNALCCFEASRVVPDVLQLCIDGTVPQEQLRTVLVPMLGRRGCQQQTWVFLKEHWKELKPRIGAMGISRLVEATGNLPPELSDDIASFFRDNPVDEAQRALQKALEALNLRRELVEREAARLGVWLRRETQGNRI